MATIETRSAARGRPGTRTGVLAAGETFGPVGRLALAVLAVAVLVDVLVVVLGAVGPIGEPAARGPHAVTAVSLGGIAHLMAALAMVAAVADVARIGLGSSRPIPSAGRARRSTDKEVLRHAVR